MLSMILLYLIQRMKENWQTPNRDELLPYPENEIEVNPNIVQNPGY